MARKPSSQAFDYAPEFEATDFRQHAGGKYDRRTGEELPRSADTQKARAAAVFYECYVAARQHTEYVRRETPEVVIEEERKSKR